MRVGTLSRLVLLLLIFKPVAVLSQIHSTLYVGLVSITPTNAPILAAVDGGYFKKYGLNVEPLVMSGSSTAIAAMLSGEVNLITIAGSGVINAHLAGRDAIMIAGTANFAPYKLVVSKEIQRVEDLRGKTVGIARFGGSVDFLARWVLDKNGLKPGKDVVMLQTGGSVERLAAISRGIIQGTLLEHAFAYQAKKMGLHALLDFSTIGLDYQHSGIGTTRSFIAKNRDLVNRFLKAVIEGIHRLKNDQIFGLKVIERHLRIADKEAIQAAYDVNVPQLPLAPYVNLKGMKFLIDTTVEINPKAKNLKPEEVGENSILKEIEESGFIKQIAAAK